MAAGDILSGIEPFVSKVIPNPEQIDSSVDLIQKELEGYLRRLREALLEELQEIEDNCCP